MSQLDLPGQNDPVAGAADPTVKLDQITITVKAVDGVWRISTEPQAGEYGRSIVERLQQDPRSLVSAVCKCRPDSKLQFIGPTGQAIASLIDVSQIELLLERASGGVGVSVFTLVRAFDSKGQLIVPPRLAGSTQEPEPALSSDGALDTNMFKPAEPSYNRPRREVLVAAEEREVESVPDASAGDRPEPAGLARPKLLTGEVKKVDPFLPLEVTAEAAAAFVALLEIESAKMQLEMKEKGKQGQDWATALLQDGRKKCVKGEEFGQYLAKRVQIVLHPQNSQAAGLAERLTGFYSDILGATKSWHRFHPSNLQRLRSKALPFIKMLKRRYGEITDTPATGISDRTLSLEQLLTRLETFDDKQGGARVQMQSLLARVAPVVNQEIRRKPVEADRRKSHRDKILRTIELAGQNAEKVIADEKKLRDYNQQLKSLELRASRDRGDYGYETRAAAIAKHSEKRQKPS